MAAPGYPAHFPALPMHPDGTDWNGNIYAAHNIVCETYNQAVQLLRQEDGDPLRLRIHSENIYHRMVPILQALEPEVFNREWIIEAANSLAAVMTRLERAAYTADGVESARLNRIQPVTVHHTGRRGRPKKTIDPQWLEDAMSPSRKISLQTLADALGMHRNTLRHHL
ncbi:hypothetical protein PLICRDRAFT_172830 [Plicaturopsis crispa FD-325 SS-3]|nr:hypothetical protein PLICRDRAFT_172830 [Plicaturopsis crispa FD-325 SS-3]